MNHTQTEWMKYAIKASPANGKARISNEKDNDLVLEWKRTDILAPELANFKKELSNLAAEKLSMSEMEFLKKNPEAASSELFLMACKPLMDKKPDWSAIQETIRTSVKQFYLADLSKFGADMIKPLLNDLYFSATLKKENEKAPLGYLLFSLTPALPYGDVKVINFFMAENNLDIALNKALLGLIFKILPETKRVFLFSRPTDKASLKLYADMGFGVDRNPFQDPNHKINPQHMVSLHYKVK